MTDQSKGEFSDMHEAELYFARVDARIEREIARRPADLRLPRKGFRFRTLRDVTVEVGTYLRGAEEGLFLPIDVKQGVISQGEVVRLDYEPDPAESTHCSLVPERYEELERSLVDPKLRQDPQYSGLSFSVSYLQLDEDFEWLE